MIRMNLVATGECFFVAGNSKIKNIIHEFLMILV